MLQIFVAVFLLVTGCNPPPDASDLAGTEGGRVDVYFNDPGTRPENYWKPDAEDVIVDAIDGAQASIDFAVMGFSNPKFRNLPWLQASMSQ